MKTFNRISKILFAVVLCVLIAVLSVPFVSALTAPKAPSKVLYRSDYAVDEHCLVITPKSASTGFQVTAINADGKTTYNKYFKCRVKSKEFYKLDGEYVLWNFNKHIKDGQFYNIKVRAFNANDYKSGKPNNAKYSGWSSTYAAETATGAKAARVDNKKNVKISWNKTKGATCYTLRFAFIDKKAVNTSRTVSSTSIKFSKIGGVSLKNAKRITMEIVPVKL